MFVQPAPVESKGAVSRAGSVDSYLCPKAAACREYVAAVSTIQDGWASPLLAAHAAYLRALPMASCVDVLEFDGLYAVRTGVASNGENGVLSTSWSRPSLAVARQLVAWFAENGAPASWLCGEGALRSAWAGALEAVGCRSERAGWEMRARLDALDLDAWPIPEDVRVVPVRSEAELDDWLDVAGACGWFDTPEERAAIKLLNGELAFSPSHEFSVAWHADTAVGMASAFYTEELALLTSVAVLPAARRQGTARLLARNRVRAARERGCALAVLAPSPDGAALYRTLGFETHRQPPDRWFYLPLPRPDAAGDRGV